MTCIAVGDSAPSFTLRTPDGQLFSLSLAIQTGPVVLVFFKITCPVCQFTLPFLERLFSIIGGQPIILAISQDDRRDTKDFMTEYGLTFPALLDLEGFPVSNAYGLKNVPTLFLVDTDGKVLISSVGFVRSDLESISKFLAQRTGKSEAALFDPAEIIPAYKPG